MDSMDRTGVLVARAWREPKVGGGLRIRVMWSTEAVPVAAAASGTVIVDTQDDLLAVVTGWLARLLDTPQQPIAS
jgi:hypothetical protein